MARTMHPHVCDGCGKSFESHKRKQRTCGWTCRSVVSRRGITKERTCACGAIFTGNGKWCRACTTERKKASRARVRLKHEARWLETRRERYAADEAVRKIARQLAERNRFNGLRTQALERDGYRCQECGTDEKLVVHHKIRRLERSKKDAISRLEDLQTLCRRCHINVHRQAGDLEQRAC